MVLEALQAEPVLGGYIGVMIFAAISFLLLSRVWDDVPLRFFFIHFFVVTWSGLMYLSEVLDFAIPDLLGLDPFGGFLYFDWLVSTPLMILALGLSATYRAEDDYGLVEIAMGLQFLVILIGLFADLSTDYTTILFALSASFYIPLFWIILGPLRQVAYDSGFTRYRYVVGFIVAMWFVYPTIWWLGLPNDYITEETFFLLFSIVPAFSKAGFGFIDLYILHSENDFEVLQ